MIVGNKRWSERTLSLGASSVATVESGGGYWPHRKFPKQQYVTCFSFHLYLFIVFLVLVLLPRARPLPTVSTRSVLS